MELTIREARQEDLPQLLALYRSYHQGLLTCGMNYDLNDEALPRVLETRIRSRLILTAVAEDTGGFANRNPYQIDLFVADHASAASWGVQYHEVWIRN